VKRVGSGEGVLTYYSQLKPGGYIELHEIHMPSRCTEATGTPKPYFVQWGDGLIEAGSKAGLDFSVPERLGGLLQDAGFRNVTVNWQKWPVGPWAKGTKNKEVGRWWAEDLQDVVRNSSALFTRVLDWTTEDFEVFAAETANEIRFGKRHMWVDM